MLAFLSFLGVVLQVLSGLIFKLIQSYQDEPYMDEIFHVPQAQQYCAYNFTHWDPMITTLPGLYLSSVFLLVPFASLQGVTLSEICTTHNLRAVNLAYCFGNFVLLYLLSAKLNENFTSQGKRHHLRLVLNTTVLSLFPVLYFFTWLYYTDPGATFFTLLMYALCIYGHQKLSATAGLFAILFRQTNVIWMIFCIGLTKIEVIEQYLRLDKRVKGNLNNMKDFEVLKLTIQSSFSSRERFFGLVRRIVSKTCCYILVLLAFALFVVLNEGIVVGDRNQHKASFNFPHVFYFLMIAAAFSFIHLIHPKQVWGFLRASVKNPLKFLLFIVLAVFLIKKFTYEHKYLLSDNRHYSFYVWSKLFRRFSIARYALIPVYMYSLYQFYALTSHRGVFWRIAISFCTGACLVPHALLEFRYYIIPFYILRLNMKLPSIKALMVELLFYIGINAFTVYMFTEKPFHWPSVPNLQRFMW